MPQSLGYSVVRCTAARAQVLRNQRNEPLLVAGNANNDAENPQVVLKLPHNAASVCLR